MSSKVPKGASAKSESTTIYPTHYSVGLDPKRWKGGLPVLRWNHPSDRLSDSDSLGVFDLKVPLGERDAAMGNYVAAWDEIELLKEQVIAASMRLEHWDAEPIVTLGLNVNALCDLVHGFCHGKIDEALTDQLTKFLDGLKVRNTKRNRIIHGYWLADILVGNDIDGSAFICRSVWLCVYLPPNAEDRRKLLTGDRSTIGKFQFSIRELKNASNELISFCQEFGELPEKIQTQLGAPA